MMHFECQFSIKTAEFVIFMEFVKFTGTCSTLVLTKMVFTCLCKQPGSLTGVCYHQCKTWIFY